MMKDAVKGKSPGYLLEGMACPGGCVAGAGTLAAINKSAAAVRRYAKASPRENATDNSYRMLLPMLTEGFTRQDEDREVAESLAATTGEDAEAKGAAAEEPKRP